MIYLDNAATTKMYDELNDIIREYNSNNFFNISSSFSHSAAIKKEVNKARAFLAELLGVREQSVYFTSGATESDNWAIISGLKNKKAVIISSAGEHAAVHNTLVFLQNKGTDVRFIHLQPDGCVDGEKLLQTVNADTGLVSIIDVNNETGADNNVLELAREIKKINPKTIVHSDGVQAFCRKKEHLGDIDLYSISAHKIHGPKGVGALIIKDGLNISPLIHGGGQEKNYRSGTENVAGIIAFSAAAKRFASEYDGAYIRQLKDTICRELQKSLNIKINGNLQKCSPHILSVSIDGVMGETLLHALEESGIMIGLGSACASNSKGNRTLRAMGLEKKYIDSNIRLSFDMSNTLDEVNYVSREIIKLCHKIKNKTLLDS